MIDVKSLIARYTVEELIQTADEYYKSVNLEHLAIKPFRIPEANHLLVELAYLIYGLDIRPGDYVLDFGCGTGWTSRILHACGCHVIGVDVSQTAIDAAKAISEQWHSAGLHSPFGNSTLEYRRFDGHRLPVEDRSVAKIAVLDAFHHVPSQAAVLREFARVLTPGGVAGFCEPGPKHSQNPESQREMSLHKVIENDIVLEEIFRTAKGLGFDDLKICLSPLHPVFVSHVEYSAFPTNPEVANRYLSITDSRVKNYPIFFLKMSGTAPLDSRSINELRAELELPNQSMIALASERPFEICFKVINVGQATWLRSGISPGAVNIGMVATSTDGRSYQFRSHLSDVPVGSGEQVAAIAHFDGLKAGQYDIEIDLVSEHIAWFKSVGNRELHVAAEVK
jgi:SAM-dependent methyltransferase